MSRCDMQGHATHTELQSLYIELIGKTKEERITDKFALFVSGKGFLNGEEALNYLKEKWGL